MESEVKQAPTVQEICDMLDWRVSVLEQAIIDADKFPMALKARTILKTALENDVPPKPERKSKKRAKSAQPSKELMQALDILMSRK